MAAEVRSHVRARGKEDSRRGAAWVELAVRAMHTACRHHAGWFACTVPECAFLKGYIKDIEKEISHA